MQQRGLVYRFYVRLDAVLKRSFRGRRMAQFAALFPLRPETRILDIGGSAFNWRLIAERPAITIVNYDDQELAPEPDINARYAVGDARALDYPDAAFDIAYSNSVIEHVGTFDDQRRMAGEIARIGRAYYVQTPNKWFPVESHVLTPFIHWLPMKWQLPLIRNFTVYGWLSRPDAAAVAYYGRTRLLTEAEMRQLFPDAEILKERVLGLTKSLIAVRR